MFGNGQEPVVPLRVEMRVISLSTLKVYLAEAVASGEDVAVVVSIEDGDSHGAADFFGGVHDDFKVGVVVGPGGKPEDVGLRIFLYQPLAQPGTLLPIIGQGRCGVGDIVGQVCRIVVSGDDHHDVERVVHLLIAVDDGRSPRLHVYGHATAIAPIIVIGHPVFLGQFVMPGVFHGILVILDIAVADDADAFALQGIGLCGCAQASRKGDG